MKYLVFITFFSMLLSACGDDKPKSADKHLLPTNLVNNPRSAAGTDTAALNSLATMDFRDSVFDFGNIKEGEVVTHDFEFSNNGKNVLIISDATASCGCTVADFPHEPMAPGKTAIVKVEFNSRGKSGHQEKSVALTTNSSRGTHMLYIKGDVASENK